MPPIEQTDLHDSAILWAASGYNRDGTPAVAAVGVEIDCRWVDGVSLSGGAQTSADTADATVTVDREVPVGSLLWHGTLEELEAAAPGTGTGLDTVPPDSLMEVVGVSYTPDIRDRDMHYSLSLKYYKDTHPST